MIIAWYFLKATEPAEGILLLCVNTKLLCSVVSSEGGGGGDVYFFFL